MSESRIQWDKSERVLKARKGLNYLIAGNNFENAGAKALVAMSSSHTVLGSSNTAC